MIFLFISIKRPCFLAFRTSKNQYNLPLIRKKVLTGIPFSNKAKHIRLNFCNIPEFNFIY